MKLSYQEFLLTKLSQTDLDKFADLLNELNVNYNKVFEQKIQAKRQLSANEITKDEYKALSKVVDEAKKNYRQAAKTTAFKDNYSNIKKIYRQTKETDQDFPAIKADYLFAKDLYAKAKETIKIKGKVRTISKLNDVAIKIDDLSYKYSPNLPYALKKVNLEVKDGEYVAIIGHNGSGKSTLSKLIIGVLNSKEGSISVFGNTLTSATIDRIRQFLGIVFQNPDNQFIGATVKDDIAFGLENKQVDPKLMPEIIDNAAKRVNMLNYLEKEPLSLSGGQKQRVAIASALALNPDIIIFDEATSMLDPKGKNEIKEIMVDLQKNDHKTIISITHDMDEIMNATQVVVMNQGEVVRIGTPEVIMKDKEFLRSMHLEIPFLGAVQEALEKQNIKVSDPKNLEQLVEELWQQI